MRGCAGAGGIADFACAASGDEAMPLRFLRLFRRHRTLAALVRRSVLELLPLAENACLLSRIIGIHATLLRRPRFGALAYLW